MSAMSDAELLRRIRARDGAAAEALYDRHAALLFAVALRITGDRNAASAVLEEAFVAIANGNAPDGAGQSWLIRLVRDLAVSRQSQTASAAVSGMTPTPRALVEAAFFHGATVADLAVAHRKSESEIRALLADGMRELAERR
jgi:RNA polymerase sigma-70 factor (ECF subfamily)